MQFVGQSENERDLRVDTLFVFGFIFSSAALLYFFRSRIESPRNQLLVIFCAFLFWIGVTVLFGMSLPMHGDATVRVSLDDAGLIRLDVELGSIPIDREVTVNFIAPQINNADIFYTDSNGLAMKKRVLNKKYEGGQRAAANYYPVTTAIAIRDESNHLQMTVMPSYTHGGSVL